MLSSIHWPGPQFSTCVGLARLAPYHPCPDRLRIPEQVAKIASVSMNKLVFFVFRCLLKNVYLYPLAWGPIFDMRGPSALGPITLVPIDCVSLNKVPNLRPYQWTKLFICIEVSFGKCCLQSIGLGANFRHAWALRAWPYHLDPNQLRLPEKAAPPASVSVDKVGYLSVWWHLKKSEC